MPITLDWLVIGFWLGMAYAFALVKWNEWYDRRQVPDWVRKPLDEDDE